MLTMFSVCNYACFLFMPAQVARLRFQKRMSLILVLPNSGQVNVSRLAEKLRFSDIYSRLPQEQDVKVTLPKLKLEYSQELMKTFTDLGTSTAPAQVTLP